MDTSGLRFQCWARGLGRGVKFRELEAFLVERGRRIDPEEIVLEQPVT